MIRTVLITLMLAAAAAQAQPAPHGAPGTPPRAQAGAPSPEALATVPGINATQQVEVRRVLLQRRDAHDALRAKENGEREALATRYRSEHERIDDDTSAHLRKLLGDDGYRNLAAWMAPQRRDGGPGLAPKSRLPVPPLGANDPAAPAPLGPDPDDADAQARVR